MNLFRRRVYCLSNTHYTMKKYLLLTLLIAIFPICLLAQETVYPITSIERDNDFYTTQMQLWKKVTDKEPQNAEAWQNYYRAARYKDFPAIFQDKAYREEVTGIIEAMGKAIPNTFEYNYTYAWHNGFGEENYPFLKKAWEMDSTRPKICEDLFTYHYVKGEWDKADHFLKLWYDKKVLAPQLLHFCYNLLACTEENGVLFLFGDNDSYPTWMLQSIKKFRPDIAALNTYLIMDEVHARKCFKRYNLKVDESAYSLLNKTGEDKWGNAAKFIRHLAEKNPDRKVYIPLSMNKKVQEELGNELYVVGPLFQYCSQQFDNIAVLKKNWQQNLKLDYLDFVPYSEDYQYSAAGLPYTVIVYLYPAITLYKHYKASGEAQEAEEMLEFAREISSSMGQPDLYKSYLEEAK